MKILLVQRMEYLYAFGGAHKANRIMMEWFVNHGHDCMVITPENFMEEYDEYLAAHEKNHEIEIQENSEVLSAYTKAGVQVYMIKGEFRIFSFLKEQVKKFQPDIAIISEEATHSLMEAVLALNMTSVYIAHSQTVLPFGPEAFETNTEKVDLYRKFDGILSVSNYLANYFREWSGLHSDVIYFPSYGDGPFPDYGCFDNQYITAINPSALKGLPIIIGLAKAFPKLKFLTVITWASRPEEIELLKTVPNIKIMNAVVDVNEIYSQTKVFLMPSLWGESFGQVVVEAMLRGIPVMASNVGGLPEAKQGIDYILPVNPIREYLCKETLFERDHVPVVPEQNLEPWTQVLETLVSDRECYDKLSRLSREKANEFYDKLSFHQFESYFEKLIEEKKEDLKRTEKKEEERKEKRQEKMDMLSDEKKRQLYELLRKRGRK